MKQKIAVFDVDGTLTARHLGVEFLKEMAELGAIRDISQSKFLCQYDEWAHSEDRTAYYDNYFDDYYTSRLLGVERAVFEEAARKVATHTFAHLYPEILAELRQAQAEKRFVMVVSKSPEQAVAEMAKLLKVEAHWGWQFNFDAAGRYIEQYIYPHGESDKASIIQQAVSAHDLTLEDSRAYGDSNGDLSMLELVQHPTVVNPEPKLLDVARTHAWRIIQITRS